MTHPTTGLSSLLMTRSCQLAHSHALATRSRPRSTAAAAQPPAASAPASSTHGRGAPGGCPRAKRSPLAAEHPAGARAQKRSISGRGAPGGCPRAETLALRPRRTWRVPARRHAPPTASRRLPCGKRLPAQAQDGHRTRARPRGYLGSHVRLGYALMAVPRCDRPQGQPAGDYMAGRSDTSKVSLEEERGTTQPGQHRAWLAQNNPFTAPRRGAAATAAVRSRTRKGHPLTQPATGCGLGTSYEESQAGGPQLRPCAYKGSEWGSREDPQQSAPPPPGQREA